MLRVGVIGGGYGAAVHVPTLLRLPGVRVVAVADGGSGRIAAAAPNLPYCRSWRALLDSAAMDAVTIAAPPSLHAPIVTASLAQGLHVLCEKPFGRDLIEAEAMVRTASGKIGAIGYQFRYEPGLRAVRALVQAGRIGAIRRIDVTWLTAGRADPRRPWGYQHDALQGGGVIEGFLCHVIDYALWLAGGECRRAWARSDILITERPDATGLPHLVTAEDSVDAVMELTGDVVVTATVGNCQPGCNLHRISVAGDDGWAELDQRVPAGPHRLTVVSRTDAEPSVIDLAAPEPGVDSRLPAFALLAADFHAAIEGDTATDLPSFADGARVRRVIATLRRSLASGGWQD